jgi:hypothetical protein
MLQSFLHCSFAHNYQGELAAACEEKSYAASLGLHRKLVRLYSEYVISIFSKMLLFEERESQVQYSRILAETSCQSLEKVDILGNGLNYSTIIIGAMQVYLRYNGVAFPAHFMLSG